MQPVERCEKPESESEPSIVSETKTEIETAIESPSTTLLEKGEQSHPRDPFLEFVDTLGEVDEIPLYGEEVETTGDGNTDAGELSEEELRRRRRRRGGRGRGRRRPRTEEAGEAAPAAPSE